MTPSNGPVVVFRCDASPALGGGHLSRCLAWLRAIELRGGRGWLVGNVEQWPRSHWPAERIRTSAVALPNHEVGGRGDLERTIRTAEQVGASWIVVDTYAWDNELIDSLGREVASAVCVFDDDGGRGATHVPAMLVQPGLAVDRRPDPRRRRGPRFAPLHPIYATLRDRSLAVDRGSTPEANEVLITLGATDPRGWGPLVAARVLAVWPEARVRLVGSAHNVPPRVELLPPMPAPQLAQEMIRAHLVVAPPSTTAWELSCLGVPMIGVMTAENQRPNAEGLRELGLVTVCEHPDEIADALARYASLSPEMRRASAERWASVCDGLGAQRLTEELHGARGASEDRSHALIPVAS
ncbi:MAG: hypothetical protein RMK74_10505 [Myxococcales bacterium]|nr:hypothetical protein [Myxococcales bacterium]